MMRQSDWGLKAEFPYRKVFILGILLTLLGSACVVASVVGIIQLAWGYYVSTGLWGGVTVTVSGLAAMYAARARSCVSAKLYCFSSLVTCIVSFAMVVLSAGGLTYKSNFYQPIKYDHHKHRVTLFLHGSVLGVGVLSLACNVLSVIVCCKFFTKKKKRGVESFKLRRYRYRFSDPNAIYRTSSLRGGSGPVRSSTSSRTPLFGSDRSRKHSRQVSETDSTNLKIPSERSSHRRDSDRSRGSSRSRHSHLRQSSSVSLQSRQSVPMEADVTTVLLRDTDNISQSNHRQRTPSHTTTDNARESHSQADTLIDNMSVQLVFDPDEEPLPPYEEARPLTIVSSDGNESETENVQDCSNIVVPSSLPLNIPVTHIGGCQTQSLQRQPPPMESPSNQVCEQPQQSRRQHGTDVAGTVQGRNTSDAGSLGTNSTETENCINLARMTLTDQWSNDTCLPEDENSADALHCEDGSASPEICALTGERMTPVASEQPDTVIGNNSGPLASCVSHHNPSPGSSDTSIPGEINMSNHNATPSRSQSGPAYAAGLDSSALPAGIQSPSSAFRPVGKRIVPLGQGSPSKSVPPQNVFSPIASPGTAHHTIYSPIASPSAAARFASPSSPHPHNAASSSESLSKTGGAQSLPWKKNSLPPSNNLSNRTSSVPFKEVMSKTIPGPAQAQSKHKDTLPHSLPKRSSKDKDRGISVSKNADSRVMKNQFAADFTESAAVKKEDSKFSSPSRRVPQRAPDASNQDSGPRSLDSCNADQGSRSAFVSRHSGGSANHPSAASASVAANKPIPGSAVSSQATVGKQVPVPIVVSQASGMNVQPDGYNMLSANTGGNKSKAVSQSGTNNHRSSKDNNSDDMNNLFTPIGNRNDVNKYSVPSTNKPTAVLSSPRKVVMDEVTEMDFTCRSTGCQATDDGGIASSMDRTHRWVMGTLPSGTRFQGTTKNTALIHGNSRNPSLTQGSTRSNALVHSASRTPMAAHAGTRSSAFVQGNARNSALTQSPSRKPAHASTASTERSSLLTHTAKQDSARSHGVWSRPNKSGLTTEMSGTTGAASVSSMSVNAASSSPSVAAASSTSSIYGSSSTSQVTSGPSTPSVAATPPAAPLAAIRPIVPEAAIRPVPKAAPPAIAPKTSAAPSNSLAPPAPVRPKPVAPQTTALPPPIAPQPATPSNAIAPRAFAPHDPSAPKTTAFSNPAVPKTTVFSIPAALKTTAPPNPSAPKTTTSSNPAAPKTTAPSNTAAPKTTAPSNPVTPKIPAPSNSIAPNAAALSNSIAPPAPARSVVPQAAPRSVAPQVPARSVAPPAAAPPNPTLRQAAACSTAAQAAAFANPALSSTTPRESSSHFAPHGEVQPRPQLPEPLQPSRVNGQASPRRPQPRQQPRPQPQLQQQQFAQVRDADHDLDHQQGKPLFSVLL